MPSLSQRLIGPFLSRQFLGFVAVGVTAAALNWLARVVLSLWLVFSAAVVLAYAVGMASAFALNKFFVFPNSNRPVAAQVRGFVAVNLAFFPVVWGTAVLFNDYVMPFLGVERFAAELSHAIALAVPMLATFLIYKYRTFRRI